MTVAVLGVAERLKFGAACTVNCTVVVCDNPPLVPRIVTVEVAAGVVADVVTVIVDVADVGFGANVACAPAGSPDALSDTDPVKPFCGAIETAYVVDFPWTTVAVAGDALSAKSGFGAPPALSAR